MKKHFLTLSCIIFSSLSLTSLRASELQADTKQAIEHLDQANLRSSITITDPTASSSGSGSSNSFTSSSRASGSPSSLSSTLLPNQSTSSPITINFYAQRAPIPLTDQAPPSPPSSNANNGDNSQAPATGSNRQNTRPQGTNNNQPVANNPVNNPAPAAQQQTMWPARLVNVVTYIKEHPYRAGFKLLSGSALAYYLGSRCTPELTAAYPKNYLIELGDSLATMGPASMPIPSFLARSLQRIFMWWLMKKGFEQAWYSISPHSYYSFHKDIKPIMQLPPTVPLTGPHNPQAQGNSFIWEVLKYVTGRPDIAQTAQMIDGNREVTRGKWFQSVVCSLPAVAAAVMYPAVEPLLVSFFQKMTQTHPTSYTRPITATTSRFDQGYQWFNNLYGTVTTP